MPAACSAANPRSTLAAASARDSAHAVERRVGGFASRRVLAGGFAETGRCALDVENVVDDLEGQTELSGERLDGPELIAGRSGHHRARRRRRADERAGLSRVHAAQPLRIERRAGAGGRRDR